MTSRTIAIGDIHGCDVAFERLLDQLQLTPRDRVITLGDYIDRGPNSRGVIDRLLRLREQCELVPLIGNHEIMLLTARELPQQLPMWMNVGGAETLESYGLDLGDFDFQGDVFSTLPKEHLRFIDDCLAHYKSDNHIFLHANYVATLPLANQPEFTIFWEHLSLHVPAPHVSGKMAVVGHTPQVDGRVLDLGHVICIDTYCFGGGWLTAVDVDSRRVWQTNQQGDFREQVLD